MPTTRHSTCNHGRATSYVLAHCVGHNVRNRILGVNFIRLGENVSRYF